MNTEERDSQFYNYVRVYRFLRTEYRDYFSISFKDQTSSQRNNIPQNGIILIERIVNMMENNK